MNGYDALMAFLDKFPTGAPPTENLRNILKIILTDEEAMLASKLSPHPFREPLKKLCDRIGADPEKTKALCESMADKGVAYAEVKDGEPHYSLLPLAPGIFELQFMKGLYDEKSKKLAKLFDDYYVEGWGETSFAIGAPFARTIAIEQEIPAGQEVQPYEKVKELIVTNKHKALTTCFCRHEHELLGDSCGRPKDVCMVLGPFVNYAVERGFARRASDEEMLMALERAEDAGLVHLSDNIANKINFVCNCCGCCCGILGTITKLNIPTAVAHSNYIVARDEDACIDCGDCAERCEVGALAFSEDGKELTVDYKRCIGCGLCLRACNEEALSLARRPDDELIKPHETYFEMGMAIVRSMKRKS
jgi:Pyruvate/2-oxoacid:ferredoxin oxidoreductase delta subunit